MGTKILGRGYEDKLACLYDSTTDTAYGPVFYPFKKYERELSNPHDTKGRGKVVADLDAGEVAMLFITWLREDPSTFSTQTLADKAHTFSNDWLPRVVGELALDGADTDFDTLEQMLIDGRVTR